MELVYKTGELRGFTDPSDSIRVRYEGRREVQAARRLATKCGWPVTYYTYGYGQTGAADADLAILTRPATGEESARASALTDHLESLMRREPDEVRHGLWVTPEDARGRLGIELHPGLTPDAEDRGRALTPEEGRTRFGFWGNVDLAPERPGCSTAVFLRWYCGFTRRDISMMYTVSPSRHRRGVLCDYWDVFRHDEAAHDKAVRRLPPDERRLYEAVQAGDDADRLAFSRWLADRGDEARAALMRRGL